MWILFFIVYGLLLMCFFILGYDDYKYNRDSKIKTLSNSEQTKRYQELYKSWKGK
jgi:hypothetical protein